MLSSASVDGAVLTLTFGRGAGHGVTACVVVVRGVGLQSSARTVDAVSGVGERSDADAVVSSCIGGDGDGGLHRADGVTDAKPVQDASTATAYGLCRAMRR